MENLYYLFYKQGTQGVKQGLIRASDSTTADQVGHAYCDRAINRRFIRVEPAIIADESILVADPNAAPPEPQDVPRNGPMTKELVEETGGLVGAGGKKR